MPESGDTEEGTEVHFGAVPFYSPSGTFLQVDAVATSVVSCTVCSHLFCTMWPHRRCTMCPLLCCTVCHHLCCTMYHHVFCTMCHHVYCTMCHHLCCTTCHHMCCTMCHHLCWTMCHHLCCTVCHQLYSRYVISFDFPRFCFIRIMQFVHTLDNKYDSEDYDFVVGYYNTTLALV